MGEGITHLKIYIPQKKINTKQSITIV